MRVRNHRMKNAFAFPRRGGVPTWRGRAGSQSGSAAGFSFNLQHYETLADLPEIVLGGLGAIVQRSGDHVGELDDRSLRAMIGARLDAAIALALLHPKGKRHLLSNCLHFA